MFANFGKGCCLLACVCLDARVASQGCVANDLAVMSRARKVLYAVALEWER